MVNKMGLPLFPVGLLAATILIVPCAANAAERGSATVIEFSAQQDQKHKGKPQKTAPARPARVAPAAGSSTCGRATTRGTGCCRTPESHVARSQTSENYIRHGHANEHQNTRREATENNSEDGRPGHRSQGGIAHCRSACCHAARRENRHRIAVARRSRARCGRAVIRGQNYSCGVAATAYVMAAVGGRLSRSVAWA